MQFINVEETFGSATPFKTMFKTLKLLVKNKDRIAAREKKNGRQNVIDKDQRSNSDIFMYHTIISRTASSSLETSHKKKSQNNSNTCLRVEERIVQRKLSLPCGKVEQELFYSRCVDVSSSECRHKTLFDLYEEKHTQEKITTSQFQLFEALKDHSDTRLEDGLLTTTLCSTEL